MSIKVLHISISDGNGGAAIAASRLHRLMIKFGVIDSEMLVLIKGSDNDTVISISKKQRYYASFTNFINNLISNKKRFFGLFSFAYLGVNIINHRLVQNADVIYIHWVNNGMLSWSQLEKLFSLGKPIFLFSHDMWYFTGGCHQSNGCEQYKNSCDSCIFFSSSFIQNRVKERYLKKKNAYNKYSKIKHIFPSTLFYNMALDSGIIPKKNVHYISNIIDSDRFIPLKKQEHKNIKVLYGAIGGKTNPYKGWEHFIYLIQNIQDSVLETIEIFLFGYDFTEDELKELPIEVKSYGMVYSEEKMIEIYQNADVFIFPSLQESFGQTLFEAMSCGVVPIAYDVGAASDLIVHESNGYIVPVRDKEQLVISFHRLMSLGDDNLSLMKQRARKQIDDNFSPKYIVGQHLKLLNS